MRPYLAFAILVLASCVLAPTEIRGQAGNATTELLAKANELIREDPTEASALLRQVIQATDRQEELVEALSDLGQVFTYQRELDSAEHYYRLSHERAVSSGRGSLVDSARFWMCSLLLKQARYQDLVDTLLTALPGMRSRGEDESVISALGILGSAHRRMGLTVEATAYASEAYDIAKKLGETEPLHIAARRFGFDLQMRQQLDSALLLANVAVRTAKELNKRQYLIPAHGLRASVQAWQEDFEGALADYAIVEKLEGDRPNLATVLNSAPLYVQLGRGEDARVRYHRALKIAKKTNNAAAELNVYMGLIDAHLTGEDYDTTRFYRQEWLSLYDSLTHADNRETTLELKEKYEATERDAEITKQEAQLSRQRYQLYAVGTLGLLALIFGIVFYKLTRKLRHQNRQNEKLIVEKQGLIGEIHHRVKNNLQVISSLLQLQSRRTTDDGALSALQESQGRVEAMGLIHQKLYQDDDVTAVQAESYLPELGDMLLETYQLDDRVDMYYDIEPITLDVDVAIPLGLIVNELVTNSLKYAFPGAREGTISLQLQLEGDEIALSISDDGVGMGQSEIESGTRFGTRLIDLLVLKLGARVDYLPGKGHTTLLRIPSKI